MCHQRQGLGDVEPPDWLELDSYKVPVYIEKARRNSLTERFRQPAKMRTHAGLWIDDDLEFRPADIELGFETYRQMGSHQHRIVGFSGRMVNKDPEDNWTYRVFALDYNMILTNAAFLDTKMLEWFWTEDIRIDQGIAYVDEEMNCEDILFNCEFAIQLQTSCGKCYLFTRVDLLIISFENSRCIRPNPSTAHTGRVQEFEADRNIRYQQSSRSLHGKNGMCAKFHRNMGNATQKNNFESASE